MRPFCAHQTVGDGAWISWRAHKARRTPPPGNENAEIGRLHETIAHQTAVVEAERQNAAVGRCVPGNEFQLEIRPCDPSCSFCCSFSAREPRPMSSTSLLPSSSTDASQTDMKSFVAACSTRNPLHPALSVESIASICIWGRPSHAQSTPSSVPAVAPA
jgi:hypothetical protein